MQELESCGFQPFGTLVTQGSGLTGTALSADGSTWAELVMLQSGLRGSLRQLLKTGVLRGAGCTAQFTSELNDGSYLVTTTADLAAAAAMPPEQVLIEQLPAATPPDLVALRHMWRLETLLRQRHPLKPRVLTSAAEVAAAQQRLRTLHLAGTGAEQPFSVASLRELGVPSRLALLIAGNCAEAAETLPL